MSTSADASFQSSVLSLESVAAASLAATSSSIADAASALSSYYYASVATTVPTSLSPSTSMRITSTSSSLGSSSVTATPSGAGDQVHSSTSSTSPPSPAAAPGRRTLSGGAIAGIVIGVLTGVALLAALSFYFRRTRKRIQELQARVSDRYEKAELPANEMSSRTNPTKRTVDQKEVTELPTGQEEMLRHEMAGEG